MLMNATLLEHVLQDVEGLQEDLLLSKHATLCFVWAVCLVLREVLWDSQVSE